MLDFNKASRQKTFALNDSGNESPFEKFRKVLSEQGFFPDKIIVNGELQRFDTKKPNDKSGWYVLHETNGHLFGAFGDWRNNESFNFSSLNTGRLSPEQYSIFVKEKNELNKKIEEEKNKNQAKTHDYALSLWAKAYPVKEKDHPYLQKKQVDSFFLKKTLKNILLVPMLNQNDEIVFLQRIFPNGDKKFLKYGSPDGLFFKINGSEKEVILCEGYSTGMSIFKATGATVICSFNAGNMDKVAEVLKEKYKNTSFLVCADNDQFNKYNAGLEGAKKASKILDCRYTFPDFKNIDDEPTDFNDLYIKEGLEEVSKQISKFLKDFVQQKIAPLSEEETNIKSRLWKKPPEMEYLIRYQGAGYLPRGIVSTIAAAGGTGKTMKMLALADMVSKGSTFGPLETVPAKTLMICGEDNKEEIDRRLWNITGGNFHSNLHVACVYGQVGPLMELSGGKPIRADGFYWIEETIKKHAGLQFLLIDPKSRFYGLDENNADHSTQWIQCLEALSFKYSLTILFAQHTNKNSEGKISQNMNRGSSAIIDGCRFALGMVHMPDELLRDFNLQRGRYVIVDIIKNNYGQALPHQMVLERQAHGVLKWVPDPTKSTHEGYNPKLRCIVDALKKNDGVVEGRLKLIGMVEGVKQTSAKQRLKEAIEVGIVKESFVDDSKKLKKYSLNYF